MAGKIKTKEGDEVVKQEDIINFHNKKDYVAIKLNDDSKIYVEHVAFAKKLVDAKKAEYAKGVELEEPKVTTQVLG
jgi:hypothetical protein